jgi:hypothetical protein
MPNIDQRIATDPYYIWAGPDYGARLPREEVQSGLARWLEGQLRWVWDHQSPPHPWYRKRTVGLAAWCRHEAALRLKSFSNQDSFTAAEFHEFHFREEAREHGVAEIKDPFWNTLFAHKKAQGDLKFFTHLPVLVNQAPFEFRQAMRLFCVFWDRAWIPLEFWNTEATSQYLKFVLNTIAGCGIAPSPDTVRQWRYRLGLLPFKPSVITKCRRNGDIPQGGFDMKAFMLAGIPAP